MTLTGSKHNLQEKSVKSMVFYLQSALPRLLRALKESPSDVSSILTNHKEDIIPFLTLRKWTIDEFESWISFYVESNIKTDIAKPHWSPFIWSPNMNFGPQTTQTADLLKESLTRAPKFIADVGCGNGLCSIALAKEFTKSAIFGFEPSIDMFKNMFLNLEKSGIDSVICSPLRASQIKQYFRSFFDAVISYRVAHFSEHQAIEDYWSDLAKITRLGGTLIIQEYIIPDDLGKVEQRAFSEIATRCIWLRHPPISFEAFTSILNKNNMKFIKRVSPTPRVDEYIPSKEEESLGERQGIIIDEVCNEFNVDKEILLPKIANMDIFVFKKVKSTGK